MGLFHTVKRGVAGAVAVSLLAGLGVGVALPAQAATSPVDLTSGKYGGLVAKGAQAHAAEWGSWRDEDVKVVVDFLGSRSWESMRNASWAPQRWPGNEEHVVWSLPMLPYDGSSTLAQGATGAYNVYFQDIARHLVAGGEGSSTIRLGWEMTGNWFPWSGLKDPASYREMFRQVVTAMRSVPGANFTFDWNISDQPVDPRPFYPGDEYVDFVGMDLYDWSWSSRYPASDHEAVWNHHRTRPYGLDWLAAFAKEHGKRLTLPEWGLSYRCDGHGAGDNRLFVERLRQWVADNDVAYEAYFDDDDHSCQRFKMRGGDFPRAATAYRSLWSAPYASTPAPAPAPALVPVASPTPAVTETTPAPVTATTPAAPGSTTTTPAPVTTTAPAPTTAPTSAVSDPSSPSTSGSTPTVVDRLLVSTAPDRSRAKELNGSILTGLVHVFADVPAGTRSVAFSVNGTRVHTESGAPYDLAGSGVTGALPYDLRTLPVGRHTITIDVTAWNGSVRRTSAGFTVERTLMVSTSPSRTASTPLAGARVTGKVYVFATPRVTARSVTFVLDGKRVSTEGSAPFDLAGSGATGALPFDTSRLSKGWHTLDAVIVATDGSSQTVRAPFVKA